MSPWSRTLYLTVLVMSVLLDAFVLYFPVEAAPRLIIGLLLVPIILWSGIRFEVTAMDASQSRWATRGRVFRELRSQVVLLLEHVRRLNWIAVDAERGFRNQDEAMREMDDIETEIREIITDVRRAAGRPTVEPETGIVRERDRGESRVARAGGDAMLASPTVTLYGSIIIRYVKVHLPKPRIRHGKRVDRR